MMQKSEVFAPKSVEKFTTSEVVKTTSEVILILLSAKTYSNQKKNGLNSG